LASRRDKTTEVRWGIADFRRRFGREPLGMWLPETAVDDETLDVLAVEGIRFTVLAPHQLAGAPPDGLPGTYRTAGGHDIALFSYDGGISNDVAFGGLLHDAHAWAERVLAPDGSGARRALVAIATDGETYGHHHKFVEVALAWLVGALEARADVRIENFATILTRQPPQAAVRLVAPSSWSCVHGVERWRSDCACRIAPDPAGRPMHWRAPLRQALDWLAAELHDLYEREGRGLLQDPWGARDAYAPADAPARSRVPANASVRARELLELEWHALSMFTSCGWFFDDLTGIETIQVLRYAARAIALSGSEADRLESGLLDRLSAAVSGTAGAPTGRDLYLTQVKPAIPLVVRVGAGAVAAARMAPSSDVTSGAAYAVREDGSRVTVTQRRTGRAQTLRLSWEEADPLVGAGPRFVATLPHGESVSLALTDLPERYRFPIAAAVRADVIGRHLESDDRNRLAAGSVEPVALLTTALLRAITSLAPTPSEAAIRRALDLVDALALSIDHVPYDVQTEFARMRATLAPGPSANLESLGHRLGFAARPD
jgi:hypothetical protein